MGDHHEDTHALAGRDAFGGDGREHVAREVHLFQREERSAVRIIDEFPGLVGDPSDVGREDQVQSLADLLRTGRVVEAADLSGKQRGEEGFAHTLERGLIRQLRIGGVAVDVALNVRLSGLDEVPLGRS